MNHVQPGPTSSALSEPARLPSQWIEIDGTRVHYVDQAGPVGGPTFVMVHGLGGNLVNWDSLNPILATQGRIVALDLGGHGLSELTDPKRATVRRNQRLLDEFLERVVGHPAILVGNSMGGMISAMQAAAKPGSVAGVVLVDPVLPSTPATPPHPLVALAFAIYAVPPVGRRFMADQQAKQSPEQLAKEVFKLVTANFRNVPPWLFERHVEMAKVRVDSVTGNDAFLVAARSIVASVARRSAYVRDLDRVLHPVLLLHGDQDKLVNVGAARAAAKRRPTWTYAEGKNLGHCPMFEDADWVGQHILAWLASHPQVAAKATLQSAS